MDLAANTLKSTTDKVDLDRFAHFQQYALHVDIVPRLKPRLSQLHDHDRVAILIILHCALSHLH